MSLPLAHALLALAPASYTVSGGDVRAEDDITTLSLEELMNIEVTVASRSVQKLSATPAAVYVITGDEMRRSGMTSIQEALRMVPGFLVGHWYSSAWDVTARGFTSGFNNNLLVMIDGVDVYDQFNPDGVVWFLQEIDVAQVERIEVIRGPGAALWGRNAVNGVINVVTKKASDTQGVQAGTIIGEEESRGTAQYGSTWGDDGHYRVWALGTNHNPLRGYSTSGSDTRYQSWQVFKLGFRGDWKLESGDRLSLLTNIYDADRGEGYWVGSTTPPNYGYVERDHTPWTGGNVVLALDRTGADGMGDKYVASYSRANQFEVDFESAIDIVDVDWQRRMRLSADQVLTFGVGGRYLGAKLDGDFAFAFDPVYTDNWSARAFALDDIAFFDDRLHVVAGLELENNTFTGTEFQPTARAIWKASETQSVWAAISRAVRTPSLQENYDNSQQIFGPLTDIGITQGNQDLRSETLLAYELGWRFQPTERVGIDIATFFNDLDELVTSEAKPSYTQGGNTYYPTTYDNKGSAEAYGVEIAADAVITADWHVRAAYTFFQQLNSVEGSSNDPSFESKDRFTPNNIANLRSYYDLGNHWELDAALYYVDSLSVFGNPAYVRTDLRLGYRPNDEWNFSVGVQNLCDPTHPEDGGYLVERAVWFGLAFAR